MTCQNASRITQTDASGGYSFTFPAAETQATLGAARTMEVITRQAARAGEIGGAVASAAFKVQTTSLTLPDLRIWDPTVGSAASGQTRTWRWPSLPSVDGTSPSYGLEFADRHATPWWLTGPTRSGKSVDVRILEDLNGVTDVAAEARGTATGTKVDFTYVTGTNPLVGTAGAPPSRASSCARAASTGVGAFSDDCWLTSGSLGYSTNSLAGFSAGVLELRQEMPVSLVVVRGCTGECQVSRSSDLTSWSQIGTVSGPYGAVSSTNAASARYVRVTGSIGELRQVSIW